MALFYLKIRYSYDGSSSYGKTLLIKNWAKLLNVYCVIASDTSMTESGNVGDDVAVYAP